MVGAVLITACVPAGLAAQSSSGPPSSAQIFEALGITEGVTACEIGAGDGELTIAAAREVGPAGLVYSSELGDRRIEELRTAVARSGLAQITVVPDDDAATSFPEEAFPEEACDALFMRDVYHRFTSPGAINPSIFVSLKPGALAAVIDFRPPNAEGSSAADRRRDGTHGMTPETVIREMREAGFETVSTDGSGRWFMVVVSKPRPASN